MRRLRQWFFTITATATTKGKRFLKFDQPVEETYRDLTDSVAFLNEVEDRAKIDSQGLVHKASDEEAKSYDETETNTKTKAVTPSQLPEIKSPIQEIEEVNQDIPAFQNKIIDIDIAVNETQDINFNKRNVFIAKISDSFLTWLRGSLSYLTGLLNSLNINLSYLAGGNENQVLAKNSDNDFDFKWVDIESTNVDYLKGGNEDEVLAKNSNSDFDFKWVTINSSTFPLAYRSFEQTNTTGNPILVSFPHGLTDPTKIRFIDAILINFSSNLGTLFDGNAIFFNNTNINIDALQPDNTKIIVSILYEI